MSGSIRKLGTRYDRVADKQDARLKKNARPGNPAFTNPVDATPEHVRRAEIAERAAERLKFLMGSGRFDAAFDLMAETQALMVPKTHRPSSPLDEVLGLRIATILYDRFGCETLLCVAQIRESELVGELMIGPKFIGAIKTSLEMVGLSLRPESPA